MRQWHITFPNPQPNQPNSTILNQTKPTPPANTPAALLQALGDLALQRGVKPLDSLVTALPDAMQAGAPLAAAEPLVDLLLNVLHSWHRRFVAEDEGAQQGMGAGAGRVCEEGWQSGVKEREG
jgi:hypothetical protein